MTQPSHTTLRQGECTEGEQHLQTSHPQLLLVAALHVTITRMRVWDKAREFGTKGCYAV